MPQQDAITGPGPPTNSGSETNQQSSTRNDYTSPYDLVADFKPKLQKTRSKIPKFTGILSDPAIGQNNISRYEGTQVPLPSRMSNSKVVRGDTGMKSLIPRPQTTLRQGDNVKLASLSHIVSPMDDECTPLLNMASERPSRLPVPTGNGFKSLPAGEQTTVSRHSGLSRIPIFVSYNVKTSGRSFNLQNYETMKKTQTDLPAGSIKTPELDVELDLGNTKQSVDRMMKDVVDLPDMQTGDMQINEPEVKPDLDNTEQSVVSINVPELEITTEVENSIDDHVEDKKNVKEEIEEVVFQSDTTRAVYRGSINLLKEMQNKVKADATESQPPKVGMNVAETNKHVDDEIDAIDVETEEQSDITNPATESGNDANQAEADVNVDSMITDPVQDVAIKKEDRDEVAQYIFQERILSKELEIRKRIRILDEFLEAMMTERSELEEVAGEFNYLNRAVDEFGEQKDDVKKFYDLCQQSQNVESKLPSLSKDQVADLFGIQIIEPETENASVKDLIKRLHETDSKATDTESKDADITAMIEEFVLGPENSPEDGFKYFVDNNDEKFMAAKNDTSEDDVTESEINNTLDAIMDKYKLHEFEMNREDSKVQQVKQVPVFKLKKYDKFRDATSFRPSLDTIHEVPEEYDKDDVEETMNVATDNDEVAFGKDDLDSKIGEYGVNTTEANEIVNEELSVKEPLMNGRLDISSELHEFRKTLLSEYSTQADVWGKQKDDDSVDKSNVLNELDKNSDAEVKDGNVVDGEDGDVDDLLVAVRCMRNYAYRGHTDVLKTVDQMVDMFIVGSDDIDDVVDEAGLVAHDIITEIVEDVMKIKGDKDDDVGPNVIAKDIVKAEELDMKHIERDCIAAMNAILELVVAQEAYISSGFDIGNVIIDITSDGNKNTVKAKSDENVGSKDIDIDEAKDIVKANESDMVQIERDCIAAMNAILEIVVAREAQRKSELDNTDGRNDDIEVKWDALDDVLKSLRYLFGVDIKMSEPTSFDGHEFGAGGDERDDTQYVIEPGDIETGRSWNALPNNDGEGYDEDKHTECMRDNADNQVSHTIVSAVDLKLDLRDEMTHKVVGKKFELFPFETFGEAPKRSKSENDLYNIKADVCLSRSMNALDLVRKREQMIQSHRLSLSTVRCITGRFREVQNATSCRSPSPKSEPSVSDLDKTGDESYYADGEIESEVEGAVDDSGTQGEKDETGDQKLEVQGVMAVNAVKKKKIPEWRNEVTIRFNKDGKGLLLEQYLTDVSLYAEENSKNMMAMSEAGCDRLTGSDKVTGEHSNSKLNDMYDNVCLDIKGQAFDAGEKYGNHFKPINEELIEEGDMAKLETTRVGKNRNKMQSEIGLHKCADPDISTLGPEAKGFFPKEKQVTFRKWDNVETTKRGAESGAERKRNAYQAIHQPKRSLKDKKNGEHEVVDILGLRIDGTNMADMKTARSDNRVKKALGNIKRIRGKDLPDIKGTRTQSDGVEKTKRDVQNKKPGSLRRGLGSYSQQRFQKSLNPHQPLPSIKPGPNNLDGHTSRIQQGQIDSSCNDTKLMNVKDNDDNMVQNSSDFLLNPLPPINPMRGKK